MRATAAILAILILSYPSSLKGEDDTIVKLRRAQTAYSVALTNGKEQLERQLNRQIAIAQKGGDLKLRERLDGELAALNSNGVLPSSISVKAYQADRERSARRLDAAFEDAVSELTKKGKLDLAKEVQDEHDSFRKGNPILTGYGIELLDNPGAEISSPVTGVVPGWINVEGQWQSRTSDPAPRTGNGYFFAGTTPKAELAQDVSLRRFRKEIDDEHLSLAIKASVRSFAQRRPDSAEVIVEFWDAKKRKLLGSWTSGKVISTESWKDLEKRETIPEQSEWVRVRLATVRSEGGHCDGYFDDISITIVERESSRP